MNSKAHIFPEMEGPSAAGFWRPIRPRSTSPYSARHFLNRKSVIPGAYRPTLNSKYRRIYIHFPDRLLQRIVQLPKISPKRSINLINASTCSCSTTHFYLILTHALFCFGLKSTGYSKSPLRTMDSSAEVKALIIGTA